jgi:hypothetical protein
MDALDTKLEAEAREFFLRGGGGYEGEDGTVMTFVGLTALAEYAAAFAQYKLDQAAKAATDALRALGE